MITDIEIPKVVLPTVSLSLVSLSSKASAADNLLLENSTNFRLEDDGLILLEKELY